MTGWASRAALLGLPAGLSEPLRMLEPAGCSCWWWLVVLAFLFWLGRRFLRWANKVSQEQKGKLKKPGAGRRGKGPAARIKALRAKAHETGDYRGGSYHLAETLRQLLQEGRLGKALPRGPFLTARELEAEVGPGPLAALFHRLAVLRFGREAPTAQAFDAVCEDAEDVVRGKGRR